jgi:dipeptidase E
MKVLALSSSRVGNSGFLEKALPLIEAFLGRTKLKIAFVPFASVERSYDDFGGMVSEALRQLPFEVEVVKQDNGKNSLAACDAIMVGGGNTFKLLHDVYAHDLYELLQQKVRSGTPYIGWSAGANLTGKTICTTNDMPIIQPASFEALGFFPFQINPHYFNLVQEGFHGETRDQRLSEFLHLNPEEKVIGLPEGTALLLRGNELHFMGDREAVLFMMEDGIVVKKEITDGEDLSGLML